MTDDFSATTLDREAMTFDEPLEESAPAAPVARVAQGPAWAGTLAKAPAVPGPPLPPPIVAEEPRPAPPAAQPPAEPVDPTDFAATSLHQRAYDLAVEPPLDELSEHKRILAALPARKPTGAAPSEADDRALKIGLALVVALIVVLVVVLLGAGVGALLGPE
jgi:hypothetical protein